MLSALPGVTSRKTPETSPNLQPWTRPRRSAPRGSRVGAELATESVRSLHQAFARYDLGHFPEILRVLHRAGRLAANDDDRPHQLVIGGAEIDVAHGRLVVIAGLVRLDHIGRIEAGGALAGIGP